MKIGKLPESVLKRSVFKQIHTRRPEVVLGAGVGEDCAAIKLAEDETLVMSTDPITGTAKDIGTLAIQITVNDLASAGAEPVGVLLTVLLPESVEEPELRAMMAQVEKPAQGKDPGDGRTYGSDGGGQSAGDLRLRCRQSEGWLSDLDRRGEAGYGYSCHKVDRN